MVKYCRYMIRPGSRKIERFLFDSLKAAIRFEASKLYLGWTGLRSPDLPDTIEVQCYEQLRLF